MMKNWALCRYFNSPGYLIFDFWSPNPCFSWPRLPDPRFLNLSQPWLKCQGCPRSILSGMCPVRTSPWRPHPLTSTRIPNHLRRCIPSQPESLGCTPDVAENSSHTCDFDLEFRIHSRVNIRSPICSAGGAIRS